MNFRHTVRACYGGYVIQAIANCFPPLLYTAFSRNFDIPLTQLTVLITINFLVQLLVDLLSAKFVDVIGYRPCLIGGHAIAAAGLVMWGVLPYILPPFAGLIIATVTTAVGGGLMEVLISPLVEACPSDNKSSQMSFLHSFYCWGSVAVVIISTVFMELAGADSWRFLCFLWALYPIGNGLFFLKVPLAEIYAEGKSMTVRELFSTRIFILFLLLMVCSGASELAMNQWASAFAEEALGVSKTFGDIIGVCMFSVFMGISRVMYAKLANRISLDGFILGSGVLCVICYLLAAFSKEPLLSLAGCAVCGFSVGIFWPGMYSVSAARLPFGGTAMFAILALAGDVGCSLGPTVVGGVASAFSGDLKAGLAAAAIFPLILVIASVFNMRKNKV